MKTLIEQIAETQAALNELENNWPQQGAIAFRVYCDVANELERLMKLYNKSNDEL